MNNWDQGKNNPYRFVILIVSILVVFAAIGLARFGFTMLLPIMSDSLGFDKISEGLLGTANLSGYLIFSLLGGILSSKIGSKKVIAVSLALLAVSMLATGLVDNFIAVFFSRFFTGLGSGGANVAVMGLVSTWFSRKSRGIASGFAVTGSSLGLAVSGIIVPFSVNALYIGGYRFSWYLFASVSAVMCIAALLFLKENRTTAPIAGSLNNNTLPKVKIFDVIKEKNLWIFASLYFFFGFAYIIFVHFFGTYLKTDAGFSVEQSGGLWSVVGIISVISGFVWGFVSDKIGRKQAVCIIYAIHTAAFFLFSFSHVPELLVFSALLYGITAWSIPAIMAASAGDLFGPGAVQIGFGIMTFFFGIGQALGPAAGGAIAKYFGSYSPAFIVAAGASGIGMILLIVLMIVQKNTRTVSE